MRRFIVMTILGFMLVASGCGQSGNNTIENTVNKTMEDSISEVTFTDDLGREVTVSYNPKRVTPLLGSFAHMWSLAGGTVVGTADDAWDEFQMELPATTINIGSTKKASLEKVFESNPDFIIASAGTRIHLEWQDTLESSHIPTAYFEVSGFEDYLRVLKICTQITGREDLYELNGLAQQERINAVIEKSKERRAKEGAPKVLFLRVSASAVYAKSNKDTVLGEMLADLGCINIADSEKSLLENVSIEHILEQEPDYIFVVQIGDNEEGTKEFMENLFREQPAWNGLTAVKEGRLIYLDKKLYNLKPNDRWAEAYEGLEEILSQ